MYIAHIFLRITLTYSFQGDVKDRYVFYCDAGDQFVGRTASGLPRLSGDFATLPPFFLVRDDEITNTVSLCFPNAPPRLYQLLEMCLSSLVRLF